MGKTTSANRYVQLTETGVSCLHAARRRYGATVEEIVFDTNTPSVNTVKRALRQEAVFVSTVERIWEFFQRRAAEKGERLAYLLEGRDYLFVEGPEAANKGTDKKVEEEGQPPGGVVSRNGWISRHVPRPNRLFTGRRDELDRLHTALRAGPAALIADPQALTGLGGIGKTQTAIAYIYEHWRDYNRVFWVHADTVESLSDGLAGIAEELKLLAATPGTKKLALEMMHDWFRSESGWLLVLDNADDLETLAPHFPQYHAGHLIITTRVRNTLKWAAPVSVDKLAPAEGALLLLRRAGVLRVDQPLDVAPPAACQAAMELSSQLDGLPLALAQAGAHMAETMTGVTDYCALYRECGLRLLDSVADREHVPVTVTFTLALEQMSKRSAYSKAAVEMVRLCAFLAPDAIPESVFTSFRFHENSADPPMDGPALYDAISAAVCGYSLATRNPENKTLTVHRMVQMVTRDAMSDEQRRVWMERAVQAVCAATPDFEFEEWSLCDLLLPQWRVCADYIRESSIRTGEAAYLLYQAGRYLRARALHDEAEQCLLSALTIAEEVYAAGHKITADILDEIACLYRVLDRGRESEPLHKRAVEMVEKLEGLDSPETASKLHNMALFYFQKEEYATAEELFLRSLAIREKYPDRDHQFTAATLSQLAGVYRLKGEYEEAERYCRRALDIQESLLDPGHIEIATGCNNLALLYLTMGRYDEANDLYLRALRINENGRGKDHPETGHVVWGLARVCWKQHRFEESDELFRRAIQISTKHFGPQHSRSARLLSSYAEFQRDRVPFTS
jgi:tetratricopeptide (TPR) repeat protein